MGMRTVGMIIGGVALVGITVAGTVALMERRNDVDVEKEVLAKVPTATRPVAENAPQAAPAAPSPPRYQVGGAAAPQQRMQPDPEPPRTTITQAPAPELMPTPAPTQQAAVQGAPFVAGPGGETPWGRPGNRNGNARVVELEIRELHDGRIFFEPPGISARVGEEVRIVVRNTGNFPHSAVIASQEEVLRYIAETQRNPDFWPGDPNWLYVAPADKAELVWQFTRAGQFEFAGVMPGNRAAGLVARIAVR